MYMFVSVVQCLEVCLLLVSKIVNSLWDELGELLLDMYSCAFSVCTLRGTLVISHAIFTRVSPKFAFGPKPLHEACECVCVLWDDFRYVIKTSGP